MKFFILIYLLIGLELQGQYRYELPCDSLLLKLSFIVMMEQIGVSELTGNNDGDSVATYHIENGYDPDYQYPYCYLGQRSCFTKANRWYGLNATIPIPRSAQANSAMTYAIKKGKQTKYTAKIHDLITWKNVDNWTGHIERIIKVREYGGWVTTVGFNTGCACIDCSQRDNKTTKPSVCIKKRNILHPIARMRVRGLVGFKMI